MAAAYGTFYDLHEVTVSPIAAEALRRIGRLYTIECLSADAPLKSWLERELGRIPGRCGLAEAIRYALSMPLQISPDVRTQYANGCAAAGHRDRATAQSRHLALHGQAAQDRS
jgi:hypothetical protein